MNALETQQATLNQKAENNRERIAVILEGRDSAGKSGTIRELTQYLNPSWFSVCLSAKPSESTMANWLGHWENKMPSVGQIVFYDRSWYSRAMVQRLNNWCSPKQYDNFIKSHKMWERDQNVTMIKMWLSITEAEQHRRIEKRKKSPLTYWKFSPNDERALSYYDEMTTLKNACIDDDWIHVDYNNKKTGIENFLRELIFALGEK
jgi:polyphosphate kinase 2 (PPK2 family)